MSEEWSGTACQQHQTCAQNTGMRSALFWDIMQWVVVIPYRSFGTTYAFHLQVPRNLRQPISSEKSGWSISEERRHQSHPCFLSHCHSTAFPYVTGHDAKLNQTWDLRSSGMSHRMYWLLVTIPEERRYHLHRGRSLKWRTYFLFPLLAKVNVLLTIST